MLRRGYFYLKETQGAFIGALNIQGLLSICRNIFADKFWRQPRTEEK